MFKVVTLFFHFMSMKLNFSMYNAEVDAWEIAPRFSELLANTSVQFFKDRVKLLTPSDYLEVIGPMASGCGGTVLLESGLLVEYDWYCLCYVNLTSLLFLLKAIEFLGIHSEVLTEYFV